LHRKVRHSVHRERWRQLPEAAHASRCVELCAASTAASNEASSPLPVDLLPSSPGLTGRSSTPQPIDLSTDASGILDPPSLVELRRTSHPPYSVEYGFAFSRRDASEVCMSLVPLRERGRREDRVRAAPVVSRADCTKTKCTRAYRFSGNTPAFPAQWLYGLYRPLPGERAFLPPSLLTSVNFPGT
jgi:hypothetical protein